MSITMLIIGLVLVGLPFISFQFSRRKTTKMGQRITYVIQVTLGIILVVVELLGQYQDRGPNTTGP